MRGESLGQYVLMIHVVIPIHPDKAKPGSVPKTQGICSSSRDRRSNLAISQKESVTILMLAKVIVGVVARDCMEGVMGLEPFVEMASWWHMFTVEIPFAYTKDVNIKLSLRDMEIMNLWVGVGINGESSHIAEGKLDVDWEFCMVKRVTKGLILWKS